MDLSINNLLKVYNIYNACLPCTLAYVLILYTQNRQFNNEQVFIYLTTSNFCTSRVNTRLATSRPCMGEGGRGGGSARPERRSREWSTCVACRNLNRIKNFGANNFDILKRCVHFIQLRAPTMGLQKHKNILKN